MTKEEIAERHRKLESIKHLRQPITKGTRPLPKVYTPGSFLWKPKQKTIEKINKNQKIVSRLRHKQEYVNRFQTNLVEEPTPQEKLLIQKFIANKFDFDFQKPVLCRKKLYFIDFYFPVANIAIEIDGNHHLSKENKKKDDKRTKHIFTVLGCTVHRFLNKDVDGDTLGVVSKIAKLLGVKYAVH